MVSLSREFKSSALPDALKQWYMKTDGPSLKVALYVMCNGDSEVAEISRALGIQAPDVERAVDYWEKLGLFASSHGAAVRTGAAVARAPLSVDDVSELTLRNPELEVLLQEAQYFLARPLDSLESRTLVELYEYDGLPVDVILTGIAYCAPRVKNRRSVVHFAAKTLAEWSENGVVDLDSAESYIHLLETREIHEREVAQALGCDASFTKAQRGYIAAWYEQYGYNADFAKEVYLRSGKDSLGYINSVLKRWYTNGYRTIKDTRSEQSNAPATGREKRKGDKKQNSLLKMAIAASMEE